MEYVWTHGGDVLASGDTNRVVIQSPESIAGLATERSSRSRLRLREKVGIEAVRSSPASSGAAEGAEDDVGAPGARWRPNDRKRSFTDPLSEPYARLIIWSKDEREGR